MSAGSCPRVLARGPTHGERAQCGPRSPRRRATYRSPRREPGDGFHTDPGAPQEGDISSGALWRRQVGRARQHPFRRTARGGTPTGNVWGSNSLLREGSAPDQRADMPPSCGGSRTISPPFPRLTPGATVCRPPAGAHCDISCSAAPCCCWLGAIRSRSRHQQRRLLPSTRVLPFGSGKAISALRSATPKHYPQPAPLMVTLAASSSRSRARPSAAC